MVLVDVEANYWTIKFIKETRTSQNNPPEAAMVDPQGDTDLGKFYGALFFSTGRLHFTKEILHGFLLNLFTS